MFVCLLHGPSMVDRSAGQVYSALTGPLSITHAYARTRDGFRNTVQLLGRRDSYHVHG